MLVLTPSSVASDWVRSEIVYARGRGKVIIPLLLKQCTPPVEVAALHAEDVRGGRMPSGRTVEQIRGIVLGRPVSVPPDPRPVPRSPRRRRSVRIPLVITTLLIGIAGCCALANSALSRLDGLRDPPETDAPSSSHTVASTTAGEDATPLFENYEIAIPWGTCSKWTVVDLDGDEKGAGTAGGSALCAFVVRRGRRHRSQKRT